MPFFFVFADVECHAILNGRCYKAYSDIKSWTDARDYCVWHNGQLAIACDEETNVMLKSIMVNKCKIIFNIQKYIKLAQNCSFSWCCLYSVFDTLDSMSKLLIEKKIQKI